MRDRKIFVDTNILVYAHDLDAGDKYNLAREKVENLWNYSLAPTISVQVLQEFYVNLIKKNVPADESRQAVMDYLKWNVIDNDSSLLIEGMRLKERLQLSLWDALIVSAAKRARAYIIWSEDFNPNQKYNGISVVNPLN